MQFRKYKLPKESFIGGWFIDNKICDTLVEFFDNNKKRQVEGKIGAEKENRRVDHSLKKSIDMYMYGNDSLFDDYNFCLQECLKKYIEIYPEVKEKLSPFHSSYEGYNLQKYVPGGGFYNWHCERDNGNSRRCLVFMTYLNDVKNGGTEFKYQKLITPAKKGLTLIWPTDFTHMHRGQIANKTKYIITGWFNYI